MSASLPSSSNNNNNPITNTAMTDKEQQLFEESQHMSNELVLERQIRVANAARKALEEEGGRFRVRLKVPSGNKTTNPLSGEEMEEFKEGEYETKIYHFHKIAANDWALYRTKLAELQNETAKPLDKVDNSKIADLNNRIYEYLAIKYLGMHHDEYIRAEWDDVRLAVDACNSITEWQSQEIVVDGDKVNLVKKQQQSTKKKLATASIHPEEIKEEESHEVNRFGTTTTPPPSKSHRSSSSKKLYEYEEY